MDTGGKNEKKIKKKERKNRHKIDIQLWTHKSTYPYTRNKYPRNTQILKENRKTEKNTHLRP